MVSSHSIVWTLSATGIASQSIGMTFLYFRFTTQLIKLYLIWLSVVYFNIGSGLLQSFIWQFIYEGYYKLINKMYYFVSCIFESSHSTAGRQFAICELYFWTATILKSAETNIDLHNYPRWQKDKWQYFSNPFNKRWYLWIVVEIQR
jgi:hypothetical protein